MDLSQFLERILDGLKTHLKAGEYSSEHWQNVQKKRCPVTLDSIEMDKNWDQLASLLALSEPRVRTYYMAVPPNLHGPACEKLAKKQLIDDLSWVVLEKPIGYDLTSAKAINEQVAQFFPENAAYCHFWNEETD